VRIAWDDDGDQGDDDGDVDERLDLNLNGRNVGTTKEGSGMMISYQVPDRPTDIGQGAEGGGGSGGGGWRGGLLPPSTRVAVYRPPGEASPQRLARAARDGITRALGVRDDDLGLRSSLSGADLVSARVRSSGGGGGDAAAATSYYEFDLAVAPASCNRDAISSSSSGQGAASSDDLGLGFCPYDYVYLVSAAVVHEHLYVMIIEADRAAWKQAGSELKRVRSTFDVVLA
jgi:hypothetical protein